MKELTIEEKREEKAAYDRKDTLTLQMSEVRNILCTCISTCAELKSAMAPHTIQIVEHMLARTVRQGELLREYDKLQQEFAAVNAKLNAFAKKKEE